MASDDTIGKAALEKSSSSTMRKISFDGDKKIVDEVNRSPHVKIVTFGHTLMEDIVPGGGESPLALTNTGSWLKNIKFSDRGGNCKLDIESNNFPSVKKSKEKGANKALVEMKYFSEIDKHKLVKFR